MGFFYCIYQLQSQLLLYGGKRVPFYHVGGLQKSANYFSLKFHFIISDYIYTWMILVKKFWFLFKKKSKNII